MIKKYFLSLLALLPIICQSASVEIDGVYYKLTTGVNTAEVVQNPNKYYGNIDIPQTVTYGNVDYNVTSIGSNAFNRCIGLKSVSLPNGLTTIGVNSFYGCTSLVSIILPETITRINPAFDNCYNLVLVISKNENPTQINSNAFSGISHNAILQVPNGTKSKYQAITSWNQYFEDIVDDGTISNIYKLTIKVEGLGNVSYAGNTIRNNCYSYYTTEGKSVSMSFSPDDNKTLHRLEINGSDMTSSINNSQYTINDISSNTVVEVEFDNPNYSDGNTFIENYPFANFHFTVINANKKTCELTSAFCNEDYVDVIIPESVNGYEVIGIGEHAFEDETDYESLTIPASISYMGTYAFDEGGAASDVCISDLEKWCNISFLGRKAAPTSGNLWLNNEIVSNLRIPNSITRINNYAFCGCLCIKSLNIHKDIESIGDNVFSHCLSDVTIMATTPVTITETTFTNRGNTILYVPYGYRSTYMAADYWKDFKEIREKRNIGDTFNSKTIEGIDVTYEVIDADNFYCKVGYTYNKKKGVRTAIDVSTSGAITIASVVEGYTVKEIADYAFNSCSNLTSIIIPDGVDYIGKSAFSGCGNVVSISVPNSVSGVIDDRTFAGCSSLTAINIPEGITAIGPLAFYNCSSLTSISLPSSVETLYEQAFRGCSNLGTIVLSDNLRLIGTSAFTGCKLTSLRLPKSFTTSYGVNNISYSGTQIGTINPLNKVVINKGVSSLYEVFKYCNNIETVICYNEDPVNAYNCWNSVSYATLYVPKGSKEKYEADNNWNGFSKIIEMNNGIDYLEIGDTFINDAVIYKITNTSPREVEVGLKIGAIDKSTTGDLIIPASVINSQNSKEYAVTSINNCAFENCSSLTSLTCPNSITTIGAQAFSGCNNITSVSLGEGLNSIGPSAFNCSALTSVTVGSKTPATIDEYSFSNKVNTTLYVPYGSKESYEAAEYWSEFKEILEIIPSPIPVTIGTAGVATYCSEYDLDFSDSEAKAYYVSFFNPSTYKVTLTHVNEVKANTGIIVMGEPNSYYIPVKRTENAISNMLVGVTEATVLSKTVGANTNYILGKKNGETGFYAVEDGSTLAAGKAYLPLPTASVPDGAEARRISFVFDDEEVNAISENEKAEMKTAIVYNLRGQRIKSPTKGLYVVDGRKIFVK